MEENTEDVFFTSLKELYLRIRPALFARANELKREGFSYITEIDLWNYFSENKWMSSRNLNLHEMVSDIFNVDEILIDAYLKDKLNEQNRTLYFENN